MLPAAAFDVPPPGTDPDPVPDPFPNHPPEDKPRLPAVLCEGAKAFEKVADSAAAPPLLRPATEFDQEVGPGEVPGTPGNAHAPVWSGEKGLLMGAAAAETDIGVKANGNGLPSTGDQIMGELRVAAVAGAVKGALPMGEGE